MMMTTLSNPEHIFYQDWGGHEWRVAMGWAEVPVGGKGGKAGPGGYVGNFKGGKGVRPGHVRVYREEWMRVVGWSTGTAPSGRVELRQGQGSGWGPHLAILRVCFRVLRRIWVRDFDAGMEVWGDWQWPRHAGRDGVVNGQWMWDGSWGVGLWQGGMWTVLAEVDPGRMVEDTRGDEEHGTKTLTYTLQQLSGGRG